jgi:hypothetical protein
MGRDQLASGALYHLPLPARRQTWNTGLHSDDLYWPTADGALPLKWVGILVRRHVEVSPLESARGTTIKVVRFGATVRSETVRHHQTLFEAIAHGSSVSKPHTCQSLNARACLTRASC